MARYNREFLVPYLQNVCALHLAYKKLDEEIIYLNNEYIPYLKRGKSNPKPIEPDELPLISGGGWISIVLSGVFLFICLVAFMLEGLPPAEDAPIFVFGLTLCALMIAIPIYSKKGRKQQNNYARYQYQQELKEYEKRKEANEKLREKVPVYEKWFDFYYRERDDVDVLLDQVYSTNIIPSRYRNIYAAIYLYDWFRTSQADDLDMALNMFVLEEIKDRLDRIIANQAESILNQRIMLANQQKSIEQQQRHSQMMRTKLNKIAASNEERNVYLSMIESNTAATAYFAAADYF